MSAASEVSAAFGEAFHLSPNPSPVMRSPGASRCGYVSANRKVVVVVVQPLDEQAFLRTRNGGAPGVHVIAGLGDGAFFTGARGLGQLVGYRGATEVTVHCVAPDLDLVKTEEAERILMSAILARL